MPGEIKLGRLGSLQISVLPSAIISAIGLWTLLTFLIATVVSLPITTAIVSGLVATILHFVGETLHQLGHAVMAKRVGHPMMGIRFWFVLSTSLYPSDEPQLPARVHIQRAIGGPIASGLLGAIAVVLAVVIQDWPGALLFFFALDNLIVLGLGAFLPLGFTDGSTILAWWSKR